MGAMASQITSLAIVHSTVYSGADQRKHRWPVNSPHKWPVTRKMFPFDDVIMWKYCLQYIPWIMPMVDILLWFGSGQFRDHSGLGLSQWETTLQCNAVCHWLSPCPERSPHFTHILQDYFSENLAIIRWPSRNHSGYEFRQWKATLHCDVVSHWLSPYPIRSLLPQQAEKKYPG